MTTSPRVINGHIHIDGEDYGTYQWDIVARKVDKADYTERDVWGWKFCPIDVEHVAFNLHDGLLFANGTAYRILKS